MKNRFLFCTPLPILPETMVEKAKNPKMDVIKNNDRIRSCWRMNGTMQHHGLDT